MFCVCVILFWYFCIRGYCLRVLFVCLVNICLTGEVSVEGEEVRLRFYVAHAAQAKTIKLGAEEGQSVAVAIIVSKLCIVSVNLLECSLHHYLMLHYKQLLIDLHHHLVH